MVDCAIAICGDGIIESAGTLIYMPDHNVEMPEGYGICHSAACVIFMSSKIHFFCYLKVHEL